MNSWINVHDELPRSGKSVLLKLADGQVHEGHFILNANKYQMNIRRWRIYKPGYKKTVEFDFVQAWRELPT